MSVTHARSLPQNKGFAPDKQRRHKSTHEKLGWIMERNGKKGIASENCSQNLSESMPRARRVPLYSRRAPYGRHWTDFLRGTFCCWGGAPESTLKLYFTCKHTEQEGFLEGLFAIPDTCYLIPDIWGSLKALGLPGGSVVESSGSINSLVYCGAMKA